MRCGCKQAVFLAAAWAAAAAHAQPAAVNNPWVQAPAEGQKAAAVYMDIVGSSSTVLVAAASPAAGRAELRETVMDGGVARMSAAGGIELPGGRTVVLAPGGLHVMLLDLRRPLRPGERVPVSLTLLQKESGVRTTFAVHAEVRAGAALR